MGTVSDIALSPDGEQVFSAGKDGKIRRWDISTGKCLSIYLGHSDHVHSLALNKTGNHLLSGSSDKTMKLWDVKTGHCLHTFAGHTSAVHHVALSPDGTQAASAGNKTLKLWNTTTGKCSLTRNLRGWSLSPIEFLPNGKHLLLTSAKNSLSILEIATGKIVKTLVGYNQFECIYNIDISPDGCYALSASDRIKLWDLESGDCLRTFKEFTHRTNRVAFSPDGTLMLSGGEYGIIRLWNLGSMSRLKQAVREARSKNPKSEMGKLLRLAEIKHFGIRPLARLLEKDPSTIIRWRERRGLVPSVYHQQLITLSEGKLTANDLVHGR